MYYGILNQLIKQELDCGKRIAIYPLGKIGMEAKNILESRYGQKAIIIDNVLSKYNPEIICFEQFMELDAENISIILCTSNHSLNAELCQKIAQNQIKASVVNIICSNNPIANGKQGMKNATFTSQYCVLQRKADECGLFSYFNVLLGGLNYCKKHNLIPIIDMLSNDNIYQDGQKINSWELFFDQPMGIGLGDIHDVAEYLDCNQVIDHPVASMEFLTNDKKIEYWRHICREYIRLNCDMERYVAQCMNEYMPNGREKETVGVLCRGTDYIRLKPYGHPVQPDSEAVIKKIRQFLKREGCNYVFLATEDKYIYEKMHMEFGNRLIVPNVSRYKDTGKRYLSDIVREERNGYEKGRDYLASIYILSRCEYFVAGRTSGSIAALLLSQGFEDIYLWNLGYYGMD